MLEDIKEKAEVKVNVSVAGLTAIIILTIGAIITGCFGLYSAWHRVNVLDSVAYSNAEVDLIELRDRQIEDKAYGYTITTACKYKNNDPEKFIMYMQGFKMAILLDAAKDKSERNEKQLESFKKDVEFWKNKAAHLTKMESDLSKVKREKYNLENKIKVLEYNNKNLIMEKKDLEHRQPV